MENLRRYVEETRDALRRGKHPMHVGAKLAQAERMLDNLKLDALKDAGVKTGG